MNNLITRMKVMEVRAATVSLLRCVSRFVLCFSWAFFVQQDIVMGGKLGLNRKIFDQELKQAEAEADEQKMRVVTNVRMSYIQALAAQQTLELRQNLCKLADDAVETSHQLANVGQADAPDVLESEVEAQQAQLAITMAEKNQLRVWT